MGLSLRNIGKKIGDVIGGAERQINPFDRGATYSHPAAPQPQRPTAQPIQVQRPSFAPIQPQVPNVIRPITPGSMGQSLNVGGLTIGGPKPNLLPYQTPGFIKDIVRPVLRTVPEAIASLQPRQYTYHPGSGLEKALFGQEPVQNIQKKVINTYQQHPGGGALPLAAAEAAFSVAQDLPIAKAAASGAKVAFKGAKPLAKDLVGAAAKDLAPLNQSGSVAITAPRPTAIFKPKPPVYGAIPKPVASSGKVSPIDVALRSTTGVLQKIDPRLSEGIIARRNIGETGASIAKSRLQITNSLSKDEQTNLARVLKGTENPINARVAQAAQETKKELNSVYFKAKAAGIKLPGYRQNYFPQIHNPKVFEEGSKKNDAAIQHLIRTGQAKDQVEAVGLLRKFRDARVLSPYQNLTKHRALDLPGYAENTAALHQYLDRAYASIAHAKVFGKNESRLNKIFSDIQKNNPQAFDQALKSYKQASGLTRGSVLGEKASRAATTFQGATKLGLSSLSNATQPINTIAVGGVGRTVKNFVKPVFSQSDRMFLRKTGVTTDQVAHEALFGEQGLSDKFKNVTAPFFEVVEKSNRGNAALVGRDMANSLAKKALNGNARAAQRLADEFGITQISKKGLSEADQIKAGRAMVERTQFRTQAQDLPGWASTPLGKVISQFKRYPYKQSQFLKREIIDQARRGNVSPALRLVAVGAPVGVVTNYITDTIRGSNYKQTPFEKAVDVASVGGGGDLTLSLLRSLYPNSTDANAYITKVGKALGGPTTGDILNTTKGVFDASKGKPQTIARTGLSHVPVVGAPISNRVLPYGTSQKPLGTNGTPIAPAGPAGRSADNTKNLTASDRIKQAFSTPEAQAFLKLSASEQKALAQSDPNYMEIYKELQGAKAAFKSPDFMAPDLPSEGVNILTRMNRLTTDGKQKVFAREKDAEYKYYLAKYWNDKLNGKLSDAQDIRRQDEVAKKQVGSQFDKNTRDIYSLSKKDLARYVNEHPSAAPELLAYDQALANAGLISKAKFANGIGGGGGGTSSGGRTARASVNKYKYSATAKYAVRGLKGSSKPRVSYKRAGKTKYGKSGSGRATVKIKKSLV